MPEVDEADDRRLWDAVVVCHRLAEHQWPSRGLPVLKIWRKRFQVGVNFAHQVKR